MAKTKNTAIQPLTLATELHAIESNIALLDERAKELRAKLLETLESQHIQRVDLENGDKYLVYPRNKLVIKNAMSAKKWGEENPEARMKLDTSAAIEVALTGKIKWATVEKENYLRISRSK